MTGTLQIGDRVRLTTAARKMFPISARKVGVIVRFSKDDRCAFVRWDGNSSLTSFSRTFVEKTDIGGDV